LKAARLMPWGRKAVWVEDWILDRGPEASWISATNLAARLGMSKDNVEQHRRDLLALGFYYVVRRIGAKSDGWVPTLPLGCRHHGSTPADILATAARIDAIISGTVRAIETAPPNRAVRPPSALAWTYFVRIDEPDGAVKVGMSENVPRRMRDLQAASATRLRLLGQTRDVTEAAVHAQWGRIVVRGEWFRATAEFLTWISQTCGVVQPPPEGVVESAIPPQARLLLKSSALAQPLVLPEDTARESASAPKGEQEDEPVPRAIDQRPSDQNFEEGMDGLREKRRAWQEARETERRRKQASA